jgi:hypothetical protein
MHTQTTRISLLGITNLLAGRWNNASLGALQAVRSCQGYFPLTIFSPKGHKETLIYQFLHQAIVVETIGLSLFCLRSLIDTFI